VTKRKRKPKRKVAPGWWWRFPVMCAVLALPVLPMLGPGWVLAHVSDLVARMP